MKAATAAILAGREAYRDHVETGWHAKKLASAIRQEQISPAAMAAALADLSAGNSEPVGKPEEVI